MHVEGAGVFQTPANEDPHSRVSFQLNSFKADLFATLLLSFEPSSQRNYQTNKTAERRLFLLLGIKCILYIPGLLVDILL